MEGPTMSLYPGDDTEASGQYAGTPNPSTSAPAEDPYQRLRENDPRLTGLDFTPIAPSDGPQTSMGPADPDTPRNPEGDDGPFSEQTKELLNHPIPEWEDDNKDPNLEFGD
jgi:hypothetical protein